MIEIRNISKSYGKNKVLNNISFALEDGSATAIVGANGAGKSTLLSVIAGTVKPDGGEVCLNGKTVGFVPQGNTLFDDLTVKDNIKFWAGAYRVKPDNAYTELLGLDKMLGKRVKSLSGGMRRRVTICVSLINDPGLIVLDEPFTGLDMLCRSELIEYLKALKGMGKTILCTSHVMEEISPLCDAMYALSNGGISRTGITAGGLHGEI